MKENAPAWTDTMTIFRPRIVSLVTIPVQPVTTKIPASNARILTGSFLTAAANHHSLKSQETSLATPVPGLVRPAIHLIPA